MSLLDDVSIVVTPNGYKAGTLYGVLPTATLGSEEVTNGSFDTDLSGWTLTNPTGVTVEWNVNGMRILTDGTGGGASQSTLVVGKRYYLEFDYTAVSGSLKLDAIITTLDTTKKYTLEFTATQTQLTFYRRSGAAEGIIDNVSVKELTSADMDVTRATAATRVDENGLVNYAEIIGGEEVTCGDFSCAVPTDYWTPTNAVISFANNQLTVDDTAGAGADSRASQNFVTESGKTYKVKFNRISTTTSFAIGIGNGSSYNNIIIQGLGTDTGEYTLEFTATGVSSTIAFITGGNGISVWSNVSVKQVDRNNVPRIDYTGGGCPHILAEPQRTNLLEYSEDFSQSYWTKQSNITPTYNTAETLSPDGTYNATKLVGNGTDGIYRPTLNITGVVARSVYLKSVTGTVNVILKDPNVTVTSPTLNVTTEWQRFELTVDNGTSTQGIWIDDIPASGIYIWGAQVEESYPTSYIPTSGSTVTRNQDIFTRDGIGSLINSTEGVLFVELNAGQVNTYSRYLGVSDGTTNNRVILGIGSYTSNITCFISSGGDSVANLSFTVDIALTHKVALTWKLNEFKLYVNGFLRASDTLGAAPIGLNQLSYGNGVSNSQPFYGKVKQLQVYKTALTDEQLLQLTGESGTDFYESYAEMAAALTYTIQ